MMRERIAVLMGGASAERTISLRSGNAVCAALTRAGFDVVPFDPKLRDWPELTQEGVTKAFVVLHGRGAKMGPRKRYSSGCAFPIREVVC
ncbi:hypothetical protein [Hydrogenophilus thermoluteolus]|uniref:hypothetical protein n=1 Tax=Hydrogenophilus thermoluteolus TaxID=297 RepID=UPI003F662361